ncbi:MAG TPA: hypothetical protein VNX68_16150 [Nitrosopumilaceae archaeon]|nr:hypothetical protein [Nitrosopumilaceae archaeon]
MFRRKEKSLRELIITKLICNSANFLREENISVFEYEKQLKDLTNIDLLIEYERRLPAIKIQDGWNNLVN